MQSLNTRKFYSFRADASALGGFLEKPFEQNIPTLAPVSLPAVGGFAMARSEAFTLDEIIRCSSAYTRVSGRESKDGSGSILITAVVEDLNILEVVTARRVVAQVSISLPKDNGAPLFSLTGSRFEGLQVACTPTPAWPDIQRIGLAHAGKQAPKNHSWSTSDLPPPQNGEDDFCPSVDGFNGSRPRKVHIPGFGRFIFGQLLLSPDSVQLVAIRADLGCPVTGKISICCVGGGGVHND